MNHTKEPTGISNTITPSVGSSSSPLFPVGASPNEVSTGFSLEKRIIELSHLSPHKSATLTVLQYEQLINHYSCSSKDALDYLKYNYSTEKSKPFIVWYTEQKR